MGGGGQRDDSFTPGGGTFRDRNADPQFTYPLMTSLPSPSKATLGEEFGTATNDPKKVYDYDALKRMLDLLNAAKEPKPYGSPDNSNIGF